MNETPRAEIFPGFFIHPEDTVADIGCGAGDVCLRAGSIGAAVLAVDSEAATLASVKDRMRSVPARSFEGRLATSDLIPLPSGCASAVICTEVLEHVGDPHLFMRELARIGRPGARYVISVPDSRSELILKDVSPPEMWRAPNHVRVFERTEFRALVEGSGLAILDTHFVGFYWSMWWLLRFAAGTDYTPGSAAEVPAVLRKWEEAWEALQSTPEGRANAGKLDRALPKSQVLVAEKCAPA
jgi:SAM-dependent methyltransferase